MPETSMAIDIAARLRLVDQDERLTRLCRRCRVKRLDLFGSATTDEFDPSQSDLDFVVVFDDIKPAAYAQAYFDLREGLVDLFGRPVDLLTDAGLKNPHLKRRVETERYNLYVG